MSELGSAVIRERLYGTWIAQAVYAAARLELADHVAAMANDIATLAERTRTNPDALYRLMRALASVGIFTEESPRRFGLTPPAQSLRTDVPDSAKDLALFYGNEVYRSYGHIVEAVRTGRTGFEMEYGVSLWDRVQMAADTGAAFRRGMGATTWRDQLPLPRTYDFSGIKCLVDVGGGEGTMLAAILHENPPMRGILVDIAAGVDPTMRHFTEAGVANRFTLMEGSAFDELPGADGYLMSCVLHVMDDESSLKALSRIRDAIEPGGRLVILERIVAPGDEQCLAKILDLSMLMTNGGRERTEAEWAELLAHANLKLTNLVPMPYFTGGAELVAIEAMPTL
jgi:SAM-dependent methyltransferase